MNALKGLVVKAVAGRDSGNYFVIVRADVERCFIADGKSRKLRSPKQKSYKHIEVTEKYIDLENITDKKLRKVMGEYSHLIRGGSQDG